MSGLTNDQSTTSDLNQARLSGTAISNLVMLRPASVAVPSSLKPAHDPVEEAQLLTLPTLATANDVREVVQYLKKRPDGVDISEVAQPIKKRIFYPPKIAAYESWGIVNRDRGRLSLTQLGWDFAHSLEPEAWSYRSLLKNATLFNAALIWIRQHSLEVVTEYEVADYWQQRFPKALAHAEWKRRAGSAVCFFHLCQAAELGTMTIGKRGQPARLRILLDELQSFLQQETVAHQNGTTLLAPAEELRAFISCRHQARVVEQIKETLDLAGIRYEMADRSAINHACSGNEIVESVRGCKIGIILITKEDYSKEDAGRGSLSSEVLGDIGRAFVNYDGRVLLFWDEEIPVPDHLGAVRRCCFKDGHLTWEAGVELLKAVKDFAISSQSLQK